MLSFSLAVLAHSPLARAEDALDEVNQARAARGMSPFIRDEALSQGAQACANARAKGLIKGHTKNDFAYLPSSASAKAGGAAAWPRSMGWGSCCTYENWRYAGAAYSISRDGQRYMQLFASNSPNGLTSA